MTTIKKIVAGLASVALAVGVMVLPSASHAASVSGLNNNLGDLFTLSALFGGTPGGVFGTPAVAAVPVQANPNATQNTNTMNGAYSDTQNQQGATMQGGAAVQGVAAVPVAQPWPGISLGNLLVLDQIFSNGTNSSVRTTASSNNKTSLGDLLILGQIFGGGYGYGMTGAGSVLGGYGYGNNLANLFVLSRLFNTGSNGIFSGNGTATTASTARSTGATTRTTINAPRAIINAPSSTINTGTPVTSTSNGTTGTSTSTP